MVLYMLLAINLFLKDDIIEYSKMFNAIFGNQELQSLKVIHVEFFLRSDLYRKFETLVLFIFAIPFLYISIFLFTKWSATPGQKILGLKTFSYENKKPKWYNIIFRAFFIILPWFFVFLFQINKFLSNFGYGTIISPRTVFFLLILFASYYDLVFFTKDKLTISDFCSRTKVMQKDNGNSNRGFFKPLKDFYKEKMNEAKKIKEEYKKTKNKE